MYNDYSTDDEEEEEEKLDVRTSEPDMIKMKKKKLIYGLFEDMFLATELANVFLKIAVRPVYDI